MKVTITFLHLEHTEALDQRIEEKSEKLEKLFESGSSIKWTCYVKGGQHYAELAVAGSSLHHHAIAHSENLYKTLDIVVDKLFKQVNKHKEKRQSKVHKGRANLTILEPSEAWEDFVCEHEYEELKKAA
ncbi:MAG: ribosome-associated translation inhibitor RaiA [Bacteriovoracaceae bacterium]|jgi:putative sigma-54 modulation protein|nr:ribosome-associated translation inhibitor RaiA [Bacteriovoracaceae bacterium]